jgi:dihydrofolate reductase
MRKIILYMQMTYDGYLADKNNGLDWIINPVMDGDDKLTDSLDAAIIGYGAYKEMAAYWPNAKESDPNISENDAAFADKYNAMKKYVFSDTEQELSWNNCELVRVSDDASIIATVTKLKEQSGKDIVVYGGVRIAQTLARLDLIDEYMPVIHPIILGNGKPLFEGTPERRKLETVDIKHNKSGAVRIHYRRAR